MLCLGLGRYGQKADSRISRLAHPGVQWTMVPLHGALSPGGGTQTSDSRFGGGCRPSAKGKPDMQRDSSSFWALPPPCRHAPSRRGQTIRGPFRRRQQHNTTTIATPFLACGTYMRHASGNASHQLPILEASAVRKRPASSPARGTGAQIRHVAPFSSGRHYLGVTLLLAVVNHNCSTARPGMPTAPGT